MLAWAKRRPFIAIAVLVGLLLVSFVGIKSLASRSVCQWYGAQTEREVRYSVFVGCMIKTQHGWVPRHELRTAAQ